LFAHEKFLTFKLSFLFFLRERVFGGSLAGRWRVVGDFSFTFFGGRGGGLFFIFRDQARKLLFSFFGGSAAGLPVLRLK